MNNAVVELTVLSPVASVETMYEAFDKLQKEKYGTLTVPPFWVKKLARDWPQNTEAHLATVIGYPYGYQRTEAKQTEAEWALKDGAREIQLVINTSAWFSNSNGWPKVEFAKLAKIIHQSEAFLTVIIESRFYDDVALERAVKTAVDAGADFIQDATGHFETPFDLQKALRFNSLVPSQAECKIWASGATSEEKKQLQEHGAERLCFEFKAENDVI